MKLIKLLFVFLLLLFFTGCEKEEDRYCPDLVCSIHQKGSVSTFFLYVNYCDLFDEQIEALTRINGVIGTGIQMGGELYGENSEYTCTCD